ncbi:MAG: hypothetical protein AAF657_24320 [Acidobacteriota bacterium]
MSVVNWNQKLLATFGDYLSPESSLSWEQAKRGHPPGTRVEGRVIIHAPFGAWIDLKMGFPALLEIIVIEGLTPERYREDDYCPVGSCVEATISHYVDSRRQIYLKQTEWP